MSRPRKSEVDQLSEIDERDLLDFDQLDHSTQQSLIERLPAIVDNLRIAQRDRTIAERRAQAFLSRVKK